MKTALKKTPRRFSAGGRTLEDHGEVFLKPQELVSFVTEDGSRCDVTATEWGFYLGSSLNHRMKHEGFKIALVRNNLGRLFINVVQMKKIAVFEDYLEEQDSHVVEWLDQIGESVQ